MYIIPLLQYYPNVVIHLRAQTDTRLPAGGGGVVGEGRDTLTAGGRDPAKSILYYMDAFNSAQVPKRK